jgi:hypothetical protein
MSHQTVATTDARPGAAGTPNRGMDVRRDQAVSVC